MEGTMGNEGINKLAGVMQSRMKRMADKPSALDIGQIGGDMSLTTNQFPKPIPQTDYLVCRPMAMRDVKPGERVLVAWVGDDAVVIDSILPATAM